MKIPIYDPSPEIALLREEIDAAIRKVLDHGQFILGPEVEAFEKRAAEYLGVAHAVGVNSGTDALVIALRALGIGPGDEVITTAMSFFATAESIHMAGATPVFVDVDPHTFNIDPTRIEEAITENTKAILPVHLYGLPAKMGMITALAERHGLLIVEDCAQSFGACYQGDCPGCREEGCPEAQKKEQLSGKMTGSIGHAAAFSFFPTKNLGGVGDGGLIATDDLAVARRARMLRVHGAEEKYHNEMLGYNSRLDTLQAAVLSIKLHHIDTFNALRREVALRYSEALHQYNFLTLPKIVDGHVFHQYTLRVGNGLRDKLQHFLKGHGVQTNIYFPIPQSELPVQQRSEHKAISKQLAKEVLSLPIWPHLPNKVLDHIVEKIQQFFRTYA